jgi:hypothetical protein
MAIFYGWFDESGKHHDHPVVSFSGVLGPHERLAAFEDAWKELLRRYGWASLHMTKVLSVKKFSKYVQADTKEERIEALKPFADCISKHFELGFIEAIDVKGFKSLAENVRIQLGSPDDPYLIAFTRALLHINDYVGDDGRVALVCDDDAATAWDCYRHYRSVRNVHDQIRQKTIALTFADDEYFPALQAADMLAFLTRLEAKREFYRIPYSYRNLFGYLVSDRGSGYIQWHKMFANEQVMRGLMQGIAATRGLG